MVTVFWSVFFGGIRAVLSTEFLFNFFDRGQGRLQFPRQRAGQLVLGNANGSAHVVQVVFCHDTILLLAEDQTDGGPIVFVAQAVVHGAEVEVHLAGVLRLECAAPELDHEETAQLEVVEQQLKEF